MRALVALLFVSGCAVDEVVPLSASIDVALVDQPIRGISVEGDLLHLVVDGRGIVQIDKEGALVREIAPGERGLWQMSYRDVAARGDSVFVLLADNEGYLYDANTEQQQVHFCVEPDFVDEGPVVEQKNDALAVSGNIIVAAPRFYTDGALSESALRTYRAADGVQIASVDHTTRELELSGLAVMGEKILGVQRNELHEFSLSGEHQRVRILDELGVAGGLAVDDGALLVPDSVDRRILVYTP